MYYYLIAICVIVLDRISKWYIVKNYELRETRSVIGEFFQITSHRNRGAAFGILQDQRWFFLIITVVVVIGIVYYLTRMIREKKRLISWALSFILGGAIGNFYDRALYGEVVDFLQFHFEFSLFSKAIDYTFAIFNFADSAIVIGVGLLLLDTLRTWLQERRGIKHEIHES